MKKSKRIFATIGIVALLALYAITFISAFTATKENNTFFRICVFSAVILPILLYLFLLIIKKIKGNRIEDEEEQKDIKELIRENKKIED